MKASDLINSIQSIINKYGDVDCLKFQRMHEELKDFMPVGIDELIDDLKELTAFIRDCREQNDTTLNS